MILTRRIVVPRALAYAVAYSSSEIEEHISFC